VANTHRTAVDTTREELEQRRAHADRLDPHTRNQSQQDEVPQDGVWDQQDAAAQHPGQQQYGGRQTGQQGYPDQQYGGQQTGQQGYPDQQSGAQQGYPDQQFGAQQGYPDQPQTGQVIDEGTPGRHVRDNTEQRPR
jgi:hypothetical protein